MPPDLEPTTGPKQQRRWLWLAWLFLALLVAAKVLWAFTAYYEWIPLSLCLVILLFLSARGNRNRSNKE